MSNVPSDGWNWFFFCPSPYLAQNSKRVKRKTRSGQWKITCQRDDIKARHTKVLIGTKRILVFYKGCAKTGWVIHEYHLNHELLNGYSSTLQIPYILCHVKRKPGESLDTSPSFGGGSRLTDNPTVASQHGSTEDPDQESSFQATMESLPPFQTLDNNLPDYDSYTSFNPQHYVHGDSQIPYILCHLKRKPSERLDTSPRFGGGSSLTDNPPVASQHGSTEDTHQELSLPATMESLPPFQTLDNNLPDYDWYTSFNPQHYVHGEGQGNDFW